MLFVTATDTDVGKTFFAKSFLAYLLENEFFSSDEIAYFKPVQCGKPTDYQEVEKNLGIACYVSYDLDFPASPDFAAAKEGLDIDIEKIRQDFNELKKKYKFILVEGAGGVAVPLNDEYLISDLIKVLDLDTLLVVRPDLGTINHSITAIEHLKSKDLRLKGFYVSGKSRELSQVYGTSNKELEEQNSAALESIIKFTKTKRLSFEELCNEYKQRVSN